MSKHENDELNQRQIATSERSAAMRLDPETEEALFGLYRAFFTEAEEARHWNLWTDFDWEAPPVTLSAELQEALLEAYRQDLFLPDYTSRALAALRASRGRAWFVTRWSYEEGKHLLAITEWLTRRGGWDDADLKALTDDLLTRFRWEAPFDDAPAIFADALLWEFEEIERAARLKARAEAEGETVLAAILARVLIDEEAHRDFLAAALHTIARRHPERVADAVRRVAGTHEAPHLERDLLAYIAGPPR